MQWSPYPLQTIPCSLCKYLLYRARKCFQTSLIRLCILVCSNDNNILDLKKKSTS
ncbi:hypothetical protein HanIR_Chr02g0080441 [Helianthus annuus]|nr:hypothetical protein HanIR_Chr02g0080441 [Helianthus annuus]